ncbi:baseplate J/gp47 family protein [Amycolatopsis nigrescens]|uniref:baseplate J/gp47 family protein n=1 Tax=Amycolatopsis nigrescens TaxID=381445 RepID=UPI00037F682D|nr:baseplate J/gp47 family protein [Amycolatopsis nigrescens]
MNGDTATLIDRPYGDLVDDILTAVVGGVVNEPIPFDLKVLTYPLAERATGVRGITGTAARARRNFLPQIDFVFDPAANVVVWLEDGTLPDDDTTFFVDYFRVDSRSPLTDINVGSVTRTLSEAVGREIATVYQQINLAYLSAFVETATGKSLEYVVSILDVFRKTAEFAEVLVTFFRSPSVDGNITIAAGTRLATAKGVVFVAAQPRTLQRGQARIDVPARADVGFAGDAGLVAAGEITEMTQPVAGIERVSNLDPAQRAAADETDDELRLRAKAALRSLGKATLAALDRVIREGRGKPVEFFDPNSPPATRSDPGTVTVVVDAEPERLPSLRAAVHDTRAAGVLATLLARYVFITPRLVVSVDGNISAPGKAQIAADVVAALGAHVDGLSRGDNADGAKLLETVLGVPDVLSATMKDVVVARADLSGPGGGDAGLVAALLTAARNTPPGDEDALRTAFENAVTAFGPQAPGDGRIPDRGLLQSTVDGRAGQQATDAEIEAGTYQVVATVDGDQWWIALDMSAADIRLEEASGAQG